MSVANEADLFSNSWYRVADLKVSLHPHTTITRHVYKKVVWHVLQNHVSGQSYRFNADVYRLIVLMDGQRSLQDIWQRCFSEMQKNMPTQDEIIRIIISLYHADIIKLSDVPDTDEVFARHKKEKKQKLLQYIKSPLGIKVSLLDPDRFLQATCPIVRPLFHPLFFAIWSLVIVYALFLLGIHWDELTHNSSDRILSLENILLMALVYPPVKILHELGHAYAVKYWGGEVHEMGVMLLVFYPVPYVDATAAIAFKSKYKRMLVGAIGILIELLIAGIAMILWSLSEPDIFRAVLYNILLITGVSTLLFNGNPLLKFDAYFVLSDWLEIPNLAQKSNQYFSYLFQFYTLGFEHISRPVLAKGEGKWLLVYAIASYIYRMFLMVSIALFVATKYLFIGVLLGLWSLYMGFFYPIIKGANNLWKNIVFARKQSRMLVLLGLLLVFITLFFFVIPFPHSTSSEGVVLAPEHSSVRMPESGFVKASYIKKGKWVQKGDLLLELSTEDLDMSVNQLQIQLAEVGKRIKANFDNQSEINVLREERKFLAKRLNQLISRRDNLKLYASKKGVLVNTIDNLEGSYVHRGQFLGQLMAKESGMFVTTLLSEADIKNLRDSLEKVELRFPANIDQKYEQNILYISPQTMDVLPSDVLSLEGGGNIAVNSNGVGIKHTYHRYYHVQISLPQNRHNFLNERVYVKLYYHPEALYLRIVSALHRFFLSYFNV